MLAACCPLPSSVPLSNSWPAARLEKLKRHLITNPNERFGRLLITWHEVKPDGRRLIHDYAACIDTDEWQFYIDCRPRKIWAKCLGQLLLRPLHAVVKIIYHLSMIFFQMKKTFQKEQCWQRCFNNSIRSLADIIRTPVYNTAIIITTVAVLAIGVISPQFIYTGRSWIGKIEQIGNWGEKHTLGTLSPCFQPYALDVFDTPKYNRHYSNTAYASSDELEIRLENFARSLIHYQRTHCSLFDGCTTLDEDVEYISPILEVVSDPCIEEMA